MTTITDKLKQLPDPNDIQIINGAEYIPIGIVEEYLDELFSNWSLYNFQHEWRDIHNGKLLLSGKIDLAVAVGQQAGHTKNSIGSCSLIITGNEDNTDYLATLQSYCISNAAKRMGKRFGRALNNRLKDGDMADISGSTPAPSLTEEEAKSIPVKFKIPE